MLAKGGLRPTRRNPCRPSRCRRTISMLPQLMRARLPSAPSSRVSMPSSSEERQWVMTVWNSSSSSLMSTLQGGGRLRGGQVSGLAAQEAAR